MLERVWRKGDPLALLVECKLMQPLWRTVWRFLKKLKLELPFDTAIPLLGTYPEKTKRGTNNSKRHMHPSVHCSTI